MIKKKIDELLEWAQRPVPISALVFFRIIFGVIMAWEAYRYLSKGWVTWIFANPKFHLVHLGFNWLPDFSGPIWHVYWFVLGLLAVFIAFGLFYRFSIITFTTLFTYQYLLLQENYLNHFYFAILISLGLCFSSPHLAFSMDRRLHRIRPSATIPMWQHAMPCFLIGVVYFYGGIAKIDPDWLTGTPLNFWLDPQKSVPIIGSFVTSEWGALFTSWAGFLLDLLIVPFLLWRRTRIYALAIITTFHLSNAWLFHIGIFPWFSIGVTALYLGPDFIERNIRKYKPDFRFHWESYPKTEFKMPQWGKALFLLYISYNILMPLRYHFLPGDPHWTERGHSYSWRMKLRNKYAEEPTFYFKDRKTGKKWEHKASHWLTHKQWRAVAKRPDCMLVFTRYLKEWYAKEGITDLRIRVKAKLSLNERPLRRIITYKYNMENAEECWFCTPEWITKFPKRTYKEGIERFQKRLARSRKKSQ